MQFYMVDVFAEGPYRGNQLAVFCRTAHLSQAGKQQIASEINFAESAFIQSEELRNGGFDVELFTPEYEVPFAGHPVLGTAFVLQHWLGQPAAAVTLNLKVGPVTVEPQPEAGGELVWFMQQPAPVFGETIPAAGVASLLGLQPDEVRIDRPVQVVSTGLPYLIVPLWDLDAIARVRILTEAMVNFLRQYKLSKEQRPDGLTVGLYLYCEGALEVPNDLHGRMFCYENGRVVEDAATGSANGCLLAYLLRQAGKATELRLRAEQGYEMHRPSLLRLHGRRTETGEMRIRVGGKVRLVAQGDWL